MPSYLDALARFLAATLRNPADSARRVGKIGPNRCRLTGKHECKQRKAALARDAQMNRGRRCVRACKHVACFRVARFLQRLHPAPSHLSCASRHSVGEVPVACLNACENAEGRGQPRCDATYAIEFPLASRVFARSIRRALAYRPMLCPVSRENAEHRCERLTNSMLASSSRPGVRPSSSIRSMAACASRASPDRSCAEAPQRAASSPAHDAASAATIWLVARDLDRSQHRIGRLRKGSPRTAGGLSAARSL